MSLKTNKIDSAKYELTQMKEIIDSHNINPTRYRIHIYKYWLHLKASIAALEENIHEIEDCIEIFDDGIKYKVKDQTSPFDLAFFNNSFGELLMTFGSNYYDRAEECFNNALEYNENYALTHYNLWQLYEERGEHDKASASYRKCKELWTQADVDVKRRYEILD